MNQVNFLVFSKDRAMQLRCFIETLELNSINDITLFVLYKTSDDLNKKHYDELARIFPKVHFIPEYDLIKQTKEIVDSCEYIVFCVDDTIFTHKFSINEVINLLYKHQDAVGFSLRLGLNTINCYMRDTIQEPIKEYINCKNDIIFYDWTKHPDYLDYGYPFEVSSSCYRSKDVSRMLYPHLRGVPAIEINMDKFKNQFKITHPYMLCYKTSVAFSNPINKVAHETDGNRMGIDTNLTSDSLVQKYEDGYKIDISKFCGFISNSVHEEIEFTFIKVK